MQVIKIKIHEEICTPQFNKEGDWIDLRSAEDVEIKAPIFNVHTNQIEFQTGLIELGVSMKLPEGYEAHVLPRSSTLKNFGIIMSNSMGIVDNTYSGTNDIWRFPYIGIKAGTIKKGDRIAQFRIIPSQFKDSNVYFSKEDELDSKDRGGIGSTGIK